MKTGSPLKRPLILLVVSRTVLASDAVPVSQRDLVARYVEYDGKRVIVDGEVVSDSEMTVMYFPGAAGDSVGREGMLITLSEVADKRPNRIAKRFTKDLKKTGHVTARLEGRFEGGADRRWGHQLCCRFRLQVEQVLSLK